MGDLTLSEMWIDGWVGRDVGGSESRGWREVGTVVGR